MFRYLLSASLSPFSAAFRSVMSLPKTETPTVRSSWRIGLNDNSKVRPLRREYSVRNGPSDNARSNIGGQSAYRCGGSHSSRRIPTAAWRPTFDLILARNALLNVTSRYSRSTETIRSLVLSIRAERLSLASWGTPADRLGPVASRFIIQKPIT